MKIKVLVLCPFSDGGACGVWSRAKHDALQYIDQGADVYVFSSNAVKGTNEIAPAEETIDGIKIKRYPYKKLGGESFMKWDKQWINDAVDLGPDIIVSHVYRHLHSTGSLKVLKLLKKKKRDAFNILITHSPFVEDNRTRSTLATIVVKFYDKFIGPRTLNKFDKIIAICKWELPYLKKMGVDDSRIVVLPTPIAKEFDTTPVPMKNKPSGVLFLGRVAPIKDIETLIRAAERLPHIKFSIVGPVEQEYGWKLHNMIIDRKMNNVEFYPAVYDIKEKIKLIDSHKIFLLPSIREAMPTALLEALARNKICIGSDNEGCREVLEGKPNCYLFPIGDEMKLVEIIKEIEK